MFKELTVAQWREEISTGLEYRRRYGREDNWAELEQLYMNVTSGQKNNGPNIIFSTGDALLSTLTVPFPTVTIKPVMPSDVEGAPIVETLDNLLIGFMNCQAEVDDAALSTYLWGRGFIKIGYDSEWGWNPRYDVHDQDNPVGASPTQLDLKGNRIEFNSGQPGMPWARNVLPHDIVVPWGTRRLTDAPWVAHRVIRHIEDIKADPKYEHKRDLQPNISREDWTRSYQSPIQPYRYGDDSVRYAGTKEGRKAEYVEMWEIHDQRTGKVFVVATGYDKFLRSEKNLLAIHGVPFVSMSFIAQPRNFWVTSDADFLRWPQAELTDIAIQTSKQRRISIMKLLAKRGAISDDEMEKLLSNNVGAVVQVESQEELDKVIKVFQPSQNPQVYNEAEETRSNARETVGFSRNQFGEFDDSSRRTATEVQSVQQSSNLRMSRRQIQIRNIYVEMMQKVNAILFEFWKAPRVAQVLDKNGVAQWMQFTGDHIRGLYRYDVGFSTDSGETRQSRQQNAIQLYQMLMQDPAVDPVQRTRFLARAFNDPNFSAIFKPGILAGDPNAALQLQVQQQQMQSGGGGVPPNGGQPQQGQMPQLPPGMAGQAA